MWPGAASPLRVPGCGMGLPLTKGAWVWHGAASPLRVPGCGMGLFLH